MNHGLQGATLADIIALLLVFGLPLAALAAVIFMDLNPQQPRAAQSETQTFTQFLESWAARNQRRITRG
jgi:cytochrome c oxidase assembly factor CtaG